MKVERIELHHISQKLVHPFRTSFGTQLDRPSILVALYSEGLVGWGECVAADDPGYSYETVKTAWHILSDFLVPALLVQDIRSPQEATSHFKAIRGHPMAKASLENAVWDLLVALPMITWAHIKFDLSRLKAKLSGPKKEDQGPQAA